MRLPSLEKRTLRLIDAIDKHAKAETPLTEDQYMALIQSMIRPIVKKTIEERKTEGGEA